MWSVEQDGFEIIPDVILTTTIYRVTKFLEQVGGRRSRAGIRNVLRIPVVRELAMHDLLLKVAKQTLGEGAIPFRATLFDKSADSNWLVVWHQDTALPVVRGVTFRAGALGPLKKELLVLMLLHRRSSECSPFAYTWMIQTEITVPYVSYRRLTSSAF